ncbi:serine/threonine-protein phosphatase 6 regulatory subunit 1-like isoform X2 [Gadus chalcogrammus]|uniref:serine/threonine-protein phosphatase 6 regulatory subunit 1-like isoform X2 n=1 Tax=Gadus chalcogrammus TaxID=1042646 RepID=UPI0024C4D5F8|nr:serine/threonine-protein phosphatase 6 regulatory subunit 1-like isoform X2 [Gadus chalcogrammus]
MPSKITVVGELRSGPAAVPCHCLLMPASYGCEVSLWTNEGHCKSLAGRTSAWDPADSRGMMSTVAPRPPQKEDEEEEEDEEQGEPFEFDDSAEESVPEDAVVKPPPSTAEAADLTTEKVKCETQSEAPTEGSADPHSQQPVSTAPMSPPAGQEGNSSSDAPPTPSTDQPLGDSSR